MKPEKINDWITQEEQRSGYYYVIGDSPSSIFGCRILIATQERAILLDEGIFCCAQKSDRLWRELYETTLIQGKWLGDSHLFLKFHQFSLYYPHYSDSQEEVSNNLEEWRIDFSPRWQIAPLYQFIQRKALEARQHRIKAQPHYWLT